VHAGETGGADEVREAVEALEPTRIGHGVKSTEDPSVMAMLSERGVVLEVCPTSNLHTRVLRDVPELRHVMRRLVDHGVPFTVSTDGPEMLGSHLRDEMALLMRHEILSLDEVQRSIETAHRASFVRPAAPGSEPPGDVHGGHRAVAPIELEVEV